MKKYVKARGEFLDTPASAAAGILSYAQGDIGGAYMDASGGIHGFVISRGRFTQLDFPGAATTSALGHQLGWTGCRNIPIDSRRGPTRFSGPT